MASIKPAIPGTPEKECRKWRVRVSVGQRPNYKVVERIVHGTKTRAKEKAAQLETERAEGKLSPDSAKLGDVLKKYIKFCEGRDRAPKTLDDYRRMAGWLTDQAGNVELRKLGPMIDDIIGKVAQEKGPSSASHYFQFLRAAMNQAVKWGYVAQAPTMRATAPEVPETEITPPSPEDIRRVLAALADDPDLGSIVWTLAVLGMRPGELCAVTVGNIDWRNQEIVKSRGVSRVGGTTYVRRTKTKKTYRVAFDEVTAAVLQAQLVRVSQRALLHGMQVSDGLFMWSDRGDHFEPLTPNTISKRWAAVARKHGVSSRLYDLRHYAVTIMLDRGINPRVAAGQAGHSNPSMTMNRYAGVIPTRAQLAAKAVADSLSEER